MKFRQFWSVLPKAVRMGVPILVVAAVLVGITVAYFMRLRFTPGGMGVLAGLCFSLLALAWLLCLGYVYGDARRRAMPPIPWTLISAFAPYLLGFLLYFAIRRPIAVQCANCGAVVPAGQRFCSSCGNPQPASPSGSAGLKSAN